MNTYDWFNVWQVSDSEPFDIVEVSFKNGARKGFFRNRNPYHWSTGDYVAVDSGSGYDVGRISLSGEMVRLQMKKKRINEDNVVLELIRLASPRDIDRMSEARNREKSMLTRGRAIVRTHDLDMKLGDIECQADLRKATFYYTAEGRVDFRELVRSFAREFNIKVEMRQIGSRQESARIGGIGSCGRELCCSTWLSDFKSVPTSAARYQNLAINQVKLSGQCGRLKCCLNYELDTYIDALKTFPMKVQKIKTKTAEATFIKADIFKDVMYYNYRTEHGRFMMLTIDKDRVREIGEMNKKGVYPEAFITPEDLEIEQEIDFADVTGDFELKEEAQRRKKRRKRGNQKNRKRHPKGSKSSSAKNTEKPTSQSKSPSKRNKRNKNANAKNRNKSNSTRNRPKDK